MATTLDDEPLCIVVGCAEPMIGLRMPGQQGLCLGHGLELERARREYVTPDASNWTGADLDGFLSRRHFEGDVTIWGVEVFFCAEIVDIPAGKEPVWTYMATVYAPDGGEDFPEATLDAAGILANTRQVLRSIAPPGAVDAWLCRRAIASGLQPVLF